MTSCRPCPTLLTQSEGNCKGKIRRQGGPGVTGRGRASSVVNPPRVCRVLPCEQRRSTGTSNRTSGARGVRPGHTFHFARGTADVYCRGAGRAAGPAGAVTIVPEKGGEVTCPSE